MSNPAVLTLANASSRRGKIKRFVIEDNIGESIHLHINDMRVDFTIDEFLKFSNMIEGSLKEMGLLHGFDLNNFDEHFLQECAEFLPYLKSIEIEEIELSQLKCIVRISRKFLPNFIRLRSIVKTPAYKYLNGNKKDFIAYEQYNYFGINNEERLKRTCSSIKKNKYPFNERYIVLFNGQNIVRDGQHRAAILSFLNGENSKIKIMRFSFNKNKHILRIYKSNLKSVLIWIARKIYKIYKK